MMKRICFVLLLLAAGMASVVSQGVKPLPRLQVEGKWLVTRMATTWCCME